MRLCNGICEPLFCLHVVAFSNLLFCEFGLALNSSSPHLPLPFSSFPLFQEERRGGRRVEEGGEGEVGETGGGERGRRGVEEEGRVGGGEWEVGRGGVKSSHCPFPTSFSSAISPSPPSSPPFFQFFPGLLIATSAVKSCRSIAGSSVANVVGSSPRIWQYHSCLCGGGERRLEIRKKGITLSQ